MIGKTNVQSSVTESTVSGWGFTKSKIDIEDINESVDDLEIEYATKGYVDNAIANIEIPEAGIDPELLEAYMPMSRDFNDSFNDSFAR